MKVKLGKVDANETSGGGPGRDAAAGGRSTPSPRVDQSAGRREAGPGAGVEGVGTAPDDTPAPSCFEGLFEDGDTPPEKPPLRLEWRSPAELSANPRNWRRHPQPQEAALQGVLEEVGWAGACLFNEQTGRLVDGHLRRTVAHKNGSELIPVLVGSWTEAQEAKILLSLDPIAGLAEADPVKLRELLDEVETGSQALADLLTGLAEDAGLYEVQEELPPELADGDREPFQQMTFTLHDSQAKTVKAAMDRAKAAGNFDGSPNENSNGNALARIAEAYCGQG